MVVTSVLYWIVVSLWLRLTAVEAMVGSCYLLETHSNLARMQLSFIELPLLVLLLHQTVVSVKRYVCSTFDFTK